MKKEVFATLGMVFSIIIAFMGLLVLSGTFGGDVYSPNSAPWTYDSGYAEFGGDFYTYVNNNAAEAASGSHTAANNIGELCILLKNACGVFLTGFGLLGVCHFGILRCSFLEKKKSFEEAASAELKEPDEAETPADAPAAELET